MTSGIKVTELVVGTGEVAERGKVAVVHLRTFLNRGDEVLNTHKRDQPTQILLGKRDVIAEIEQGIEGMREGGRRELIISPHLAYGQNGLPGTIPPNAVLRCEVELLKVRSPGEAVPEAFPPGKHLSVHRAGEAARNLAAWQLGVEQSGRAGISITKPPPEGATWRHMRPQGFDIEISQKEAQLIFEEVLEIPQKSRHEVLAPDDIGVDTAEKANSIPRESKTDTPCLSITVWEKGVLLCNYYLRENSEVLMNSRFYKAAAKALAVHIGGSGLKF